MSASLNLTSDLSEAPQAVPAPANRTYYPVLDGIRAMAFLAVFGVHYGALPWGWGGVDVFFVLSGFLITGILFDTRDQSHRARNFYIRRTLRIFPLYYGVMLLLVLSYPFLRWQWTWAWLLWPAYLGNFLRGLHPFSPGMPLQLAADFQPLSRTIHGFKLLLGHFWSLCVEEQFYLFWPWVVFYVRDRKKLMTICAAAVVICLCLRIGGEHLLPKYMLDQEVLYRWTPFRVDALLLGGWLALAERGPVRRRLFQMAKPCFALLSGIAIVWLVRNQFVHRGATAYVYPPWTHTWALTYLDLWAASLIVYAIQPGTWSFRLFDLRPLRWVGRISYGAYVFHDIFHEQIEKLCYLAGVHHLERTCAAVGLAITLLLSWASFRWFEAPFIRLKDRWARPTTARSS